MRAVSYNEFGGPEVLHVAEVATPGPGPGQVRVRVAASVLHPVDVMVRSGQFPAPLPTALGQVARFVLTTGSLAAARLVGRVVPDHANFRIGLRFKVLASVLRRLPRVLSVRPGTAADRRAGDD